MFSPYHLPRSVATPPLQPLPIDAVIPQILAAARDHGAVVVVAPPGSGKTTRVPPALLDAGLSRGGKLVLLQPRRVAARLCASRIAWERGSRVGDEVGYRVRFENKTSARTRLEVLTEGLLTRRLREDPYLQDTGIVVLDEFHERSLHADLALAFLAELRQSGREDLGIVVMSATLDPGPVAAFLGGAPIVEARGRTFPVSVEYDKRPAQTPPWERAALAAARLIGEDIDGHVLVFLPGVSEIRRAEDHLRAAQAAPEASAALRNALILPLHGRLPGAEQDRALAPSRERKIVLTTNLAETSVTLDGVRSVVDTGLARVPRWDPSLGIERLETVRCSRASADQRAGRAGRTVAGRCRRLWTEADHEERATAEVPELRRADLCGPVLDLLGWGVDPKALRWFEAPPASHLDRAMETLRMLGCVDDRGLTGTGRDVGRLPAHPRMGRVLLEAKRRACLASAATVAAIVEIGDPFRHGADDPRDPVGARLASLAEAEWKGRPPPGVDRGPWEQLRRTRDQLVSIGERIAVDPVPGAMDDEFALARAVIAGFPDRLAVRRAANSDRLRLASGQGAVLGVPVPGATILLVLDMDAGPSGADARVRLAMPVPESILESREQVELRWDEEKETVVQRRVRRLGGLVLGELPATSAPDPEAASRTLLEAARLAPQRALAPDADAETTLRRLRLLERVMPELGLRAPASFADLLPELVVARRSFAELRAANLDAALLAPLDWGQRQALDRHAPTRIEVPSGSTVPILYSEDPADPPILAARIQQLFGMKETPRIAGGRVPLLVHLLAPNGRPQQVTRDLGSFWTHTWAEVRKDLRGRYPRHSWPEDPWTAVAVDRPKRRS